MSDVKKHLTHLEAVGLIRLVKTHPELEFMFRHALIQEAAYTSLLIEDRKKLHRQVGEAIEQTYPNQVASRELAPVLADHFAKAEDDQGALKYFTLAGDANAAAYANAEAVAHYADALEIAKRLEVSGEQLTHLYGQRGRTLELNSQFDEALANYEEMEKVAQQRSDPPMELTGLIARTRLYVTFTPVIDQVRGETLAEEALSLAREQKDEVAEAKILWLQLLLYAHTQRVSQAIDCGERSLALTRKLNLREQMAYTLNDLGLHGYFNSGHYDQAKVVLPEASALWRELDNLPMLADSLSASCQVSVIAGEYDQAVALSDEAFQISQSIDNSWGQSYSRYRVGLAYWERGEPDKAIETIEECLNLSLLGSFADPQVTTRAQLVAIYGSLGAIERGLETAQLALAAADAQRRSSRQSVLNALAQLHIRQGNLTEAEVAINEGKKVGEFPGVRLAEAELALRQGNYQQAIDLADNFISELRQSGGRLYIPDGLNLQAQALQAMGQDKAARQCWLEARAEAEAIGSRRMLWQILAALAEIESDPTEAKTLRQQAQEIIEYIADHTPTDLRSSFLNLSAVRAVMEG